MIETHIKPILTDGLKTNHENCVLVFKNNNISHYSRRSCMAAKPPAWQYFLFW